MSTARRTPLVSVVIATYQAEQWIGEALRSILSQTRPPDEVVVVDDGSTDGTRAVLENFGTQIRVVWQPNAGYPAAMNRAIREAHGEYVAPCGADDVWEPRKLEWQVETLERHPELDVLFGHAVFFGAFNADHVRPSGEGLLNNHELARDLFRCNVINMPSVVLRRDLFDRVGWFRDRFVADDYEFFFNCLRVGARFYYDPRPLVRYRRHDANITNNAEELIRAMLQVQSANVDRLDDPALVRSVLAGQLFKLGRLLADQGRDGEARDAFHACARRAAPALPSVAIRAATWVALLSLPASPRQQIAGVLVGASRRWDDLRGGRSPALP
jgi:glycosyltransferase involved in cell wall biosynthesis